MNSRIRLLLFAVSFLSLATLITFAASHYRQDPQERRIDHTPWTNAPVKVIGVKSKEKDRPVNNKFQEKDDDWLRGITVKLKNVSDKTIVHIEAELEFPRPKDSPFSAEPPLVIPLFYGNRPSQQEGAALTITKDFVKPGDNVEIRLPDMTHDDAKITLSKENYPLRINHLKIQINIVLFDDGTMWHAGGFMRRDPNNPKRWIPIEEPSRGTVPTPKTDSKALTFRTISYAIRDDNKSSAPLRRESSLARTKAALVTGCVVRGAGRYQPCVFDLDSCELFYDEEHANLISGPFVLLVPKKVKCSSTNPNVNRGFNLEVQQNVL